MVERLLGMPTANGGMAALVGVVALAGIGGRPVGPPSPALGNGCEDFIGRDADHSVYTDVDDGGARLRLTRRAVLTGASKGKWVGAILRLDGPTGASATYGDFLAKQGDAICFEFTRNSKDPYKSKAKLRRRKDAQNGKNDAPLSGIYCTTKDMNDATTAPQWIVIPAHCDTVHYTVRDTSDKVIVVSVPLTGVRAADERTIGAALLNAGIPAAIIARVDTYGPWYPCEPYGCCRAYGLQ